MHIPSAQAGFSTSTVVIVIPAYKPGEHLITLVDALQRAGAPPIIVVNDGSGTDFDGAFQELALKPDVHLLHHAVNLGKGAALKTGMNYALVRYPGCGVVTADADGQHHPDDILAIVGRLLANPHSLIMGTRSFTRSVPLRSRAGNQLTRALMKLVVGQTLSDTQTGLRGVPNRLIPHLLKVPTSGYEFELDMLIACKHQSCPVVEQPIRTIYIEGNKSSHFHPLLDSMRIYLLLFRFSILSLLTAGLDNLVFIAAFSATGSIGQSQIVGRLVAMVFNYAGARRAVFHSQQRHTIVFPKYVLLVICNGLLSYALIQLLHGRLTFGAVSAKILAEALLFIGNFAVQRDLVFTQRHPSNMLKTDWDRYYEAVPATATLTRKYTTSVLEAAIKRFAPASKPDGLSIIEIGGANSCFLHRIFGTFHPLSYDVIDTNEYGLSLLAKRLGNDTRIRLHQQDVLSLSLKARADVVFSVGLIEHFTPEETRQAVLAHFDLLAPNGIAIISFPTPTLLYRITRRLIEALGMWKFHDERPLDRSEVLAAFGERGQVVFQKTLWPLFLTQHLIVVRKSASSQSVPDGSVQPAY